MSCEPCGFSPKSPIEIVNLTFDFTPALGTDEFIVGIASVTSEVFEGVDPNPEAMVTATPLINISGQSIQQPTQGGLVGVSYRITALALTTAGQELACAGTLTIKDV